jgi:hypothetical protein
VQLTTEFETDRRFTFVEGDVNTWTASGQIDVVLCSSTFEHLYPDCRRALLNLRAQLASGTSVFIDFVKYDHARRWFEPDGRTYIRTYPLDELISLFSSCGYLVKGIEECRLGIGVDGPVDRFVVIAGPDTSSRSSFRSAG